jgi:hypothetical protein
MSEELDKVRAELDGYRHPFFDFSAEQTDDGIDVCVRSRVEGVHSPEYHFTLSTREVDHPQFRWSFQGLLYGNLNDYMVELFTGSPGDPQKP